MKKVLLLMLSFIIILAGPACFAAYISYGGGVYGGGGYYGGSYYGGGMSYGYGGNRQYYHRPTYPVTPAMTRHNTVPATPISCLGTGSYAVIGGNVMPCKSAAATRIKMTNKNKPSMKKQSNKNISKLSKNKKDNEV